MSGLVNHPSHYNHDGRKECWDEWIDKFGLDEAVVVCLGCTDKYLYRAGTKKGNTREQDIQKARAFFGKAADLVANNKHKIRVGTLRMFLIVKEELANYDKD